jgi:hypothetical protein
MEIKLKMAPIHDESDKDGNQSNNYPDKKNGRNKYGNCIHNPAISTPPNLSVISYNNKTKIHVVRGTENYKKCLLSSFCLRQSLLCTRQEKINKKLKRNIVKKYTDDVQS